MTDGAGLRTLPHAWPRPLSTPCMHQLREPPVITTDRLILRLAAPEDAPAIVRYFSENRAHLAPSRPLMDAEFFTEDFWRAQAQAARAEFRADRSARFFAWDREDRGRIIANANFSQFVRGAAHYTVLGYGIAADREGRGLMREALEAGIGYVFGELNLHRVMANYVPTNHRSGGLLRRLGFRVEGYARDYLYLDGAWRDHVLTARSNPEWRPEG
jgi:[ribosomal protein S5]-alanine N-acetyltransferase